MVRLLLMCVWLYVCACMFNVCVLACELLCDGVWLDLLFCYVCVRVFVCDVFGVCFC